MKKLQLCHNPQKNKLADICTTDKTRTEIEPVLFSVHIYELCPFVLCSFLLFIWTNDTRLFLFKA